MLKARTEQTEDTYTENNTCHNNIQTTVLRLTQLFALPVTANEYHQYLGLAIIINGGSGCRRQQTRDSRLTDIETSPRH